MDKNTKVKMGLFSIILFGFNGIIGSGIFLLPGKAYASIGPASILVMLFDAILVASIAFCFAEVACLFEKNGGPYVYAKEAFGDFAGFEVGFLKWITSITSWAVVAAAFSEALSTITPISLPKQKIISITLVTVLTCLSLLGIKTSKLLNNVVTIGKLVPLIIFIVVGVFFLNFENFHFNDMNKFFVPVEGTTIMQSFGQSAITMFYAFTGFEAIAIAAEDMENPKKNLPKAIVIVIILVTIFYLLIQSISISVLGDKLSTVDAPIQEAFNVMIGPAGKYLVAVGTIISIGGINIASSIVTPRSAAAVADDGILPKIMSKKNKNNVAYMSVILSGVFTILLSLTGTFQQLLALNVVARFTQYIPTCLSLIVFRTKLKDAERVFKIPFSPFSPIFAVGVSLWLLAQSDPKKLLQGLYALIIIAVFYFVLKFVNNKE